MADTKVASQITDHAYKPKTDWYGPCVECGLTESAHQATSLKPEDRNMKHEYRCPYCVDRGIESCEHRGAPIGLNGEPLKGEGREQ